jgi:hypothetical protein
MKKVIDRSLQAISLQPTFEMKGVMVIIHGETPADNMVTSLSLKEARLLAYELLLEAERQEPETL